MPIAIFCNRINTVRIEQKISFTPNIIQNQIRMSRLLCVLSCTLLWSLLNTISSQNLTSIKLSSPEPLFLEPSENATESNQPALLVLSIKGRRSFERIVTNTTKPGATTQSYSSQLIGCPEVVFSTEVAIGGQGVRFKKFY